MDKEKEKKKTLTISSNFKKKIDSNNLSKNEISDANPLNVFVSIFPVL